MALFWNKGWLFYNKMVALCPDGTGATGSHSYLGNEEETVMIEGTPTPFSPFSPVDCTLLSHFSFNDFIAVAFLDLAGDLDAQI